MTDKQRSNMKTEDLPDTIPALRPVPLLTMIVACLVMFLVDWITGWSILVAGAAYVIGGPLAAAIDELVTL